MLCLSINCINDYDLRRFTMDKENNEIKHICQLCLDDTKRKKL